MRWFRKIIRVILVVAIGALGSIPFRRLPPPGQTGVSPSADRLVLQNDSAQTVRELPLQIGPPASAVTQAERDSNDATEAVTAGPRTADNRAPQSARKDLPAWNSRLESPTPPPALPDNFGGHNFGGQAPASQAPASQAPASQAPASQAPASQAPASPSSQFPGGAAPKYGEPTTPARQTFESNGSPNGPDFGSP